MQAGRAHDAGGRSNSMRLIALIFLLLTVIAPARAQVGFDRPGGDYASFPIRGGDPATCALRCEHEGRCRAWAFSYPSADGTATCWLKAQVPTRIEEPSSVSGVRGAGVVAPKRGPVEFSIDRGGGDYKNVDLAPDPTGLSCKAACEADNRCRAWTYVRPGYGGSSARCYLKDKVKTPHHKPCCISGVVR
jgi:PAN domain-containing protein